VLSTLSPASFLASTPVSSTKAPRVPEPSSRETTIISTGLTVVGSATLGASVALGAEVVGCS